MSLDPQPVWAFHGAWLEGGETLVITDVLAGALRFYDGNGGALKTMAGPRGGAVDFDRPSRIWSTAGGILVKDASGFLWLDEDLSLVRSLDLDEVPMATQGTVRALFETAATEDGIFGIGDIRMPDQSWRTGFVLVQQRDAQDYRFLREMPLRDREEFDHYLMGYPHVATLEDRGYFLAMDETPHLLEAAHGETPRRLESFPERFAKRPELPLHRGKVGGEIRYRAYELARLAVALYGHGGRLYVLGREPISEPEGGGSRWTLTKIDPETDLVEGAVVLPTRAAHLTVIPGPERWVVLEKGRVEKMGIQAIPTMILVPARWIETWPSPLAVEELEETSCAEP